MSNIRYNNRATKKHFIGDGDRFQLAISQLLGKRITYQELTGNGMERPSQDVPF